MEVQIENKKIPNKVFSIGIALIVIGGILAAASFIFNPDRAYFNYVIMYMFIVSIAIGSLGLVAMEYLVGASWSVPFRRISEFLSSVTPLLVLLVIPIILGMHTLYHWTHHDAVEADPILKGKEPYLNTSFFLIRLAIYFIIWIIFFIIFIRNSQKQDVTRDPKLTRRSVAFSALFAPLFIITLTFLAVDLVMSLEPHYYSTMFGVYYFAGTLGVAFAALTLIAVLLKQNGYLDPRISNDQFYSLGTMMFAFVIFWAYIAFSQFVLQWYADIPDETFWYTMRWEGGWKYVSIGLLFFHFILPFLILLPRSTKTNLQKLKIMSIWMLAAHYLDMYWLVMPTYTHAHGMHGPVFGWIEIGFPLIAVGLFMVAFKMKSNKTNLIPVGDPKLQNALDFHLY
ncbi:MAG TPA: quinol:cytochrome C oxidoreductase [Ignavibacteria bacterium]|nr:quinol:cytochrome C oxidoreductase [Ignavibacteria bacterium]